METKTDPAVAAQAQLEGLESELRQLRLGNASMQATGTMPTWAAWLWRRRVPLGLGAIVMALVMKGRKK